MDHGPDVASSRDDYGLKTMTPERWEQVRAMLASALERAPEDRAAYLDQVSMEPSLRREVESLPDERRAGRHLDRRIRVAFHDAQHAATLQLNLAH